MSRRRRAEKREVQPDPKFGNLQLTKFINRIMYQGKRPVAEGIVYGAFDIIEKKSKTQQPSQVAQRLTSITT
jgi:small subunit ribosomal protein S7